MGSHVFGFLGLDSSSYLRLENVPECLYCRWKMGQSILGSRKLHICLKSD